MDWKRWCFLVKEIFFILLLFMGLIMDKEGKFMVLNKLIKVGVIVVVVIGVGVVNV